MTSEVIKGHLRLSLSLKSFLQFIFVSRLILITFEECQHYEDAYFSLYDIWPLRSSKVKEDHLYAKNILAHSFMDRLNNVEFAQYKFTNLKRTQLTQKKKSQTISVRVHYKCVFQYPFLSFLTFFLYHQQFSISLSLYIPFLSL